MVGVKRLEERHKPAIDTLDWTSGDATLRSTIKPVTVRPYKLENPSIQVNLLPQLRYNQWHLSNACVTVL